jgi:WD40 repeat protein
MALIADGKTLLVGAAARKNPDSIYEPSTGEVRIWDLGKTSNPAILEGGEGAKPLFSPDGRTLAFGPTLWDVATREQRQSLTDPDLGSPGFVAFLPGSDPPSSIRVLYTAFEGGRVESRMRDLPRGKARSMTRETEKGRQPSSLVALSPDGRTLVDATIPDMENPHRLRLWDVETGKLRATLKVPVYCGPSAFSPDGKTLALMAGEDGTATVQSQRQVRVWDVATGEEQAVFGDFLGTVHGLAFSPDGKELAICLSKQSPTGVRGEVRIWNVETRRPMAVIQYPSPMYAVAFSHDGKNVAGVSADDTIRLWHASTGQERAVLQAPLIENPNFFTRPNQRKTIPLPIRGLIFSPDGKSLVGWDHGVVGGAAPKHTMAWWNLRGD